jgi:hypothetical protein
MMPGIDLLCQLNPLTAYQFDAAVVAFGTTIENALQEQIQVGAGKDKRWKQKYKLSDLLNDKFQFQRENPLTALQGVEGYEEVSA